MMKNFKYVMLMAAALTMGLSSCSNNDDLGNGETIDTGRPTKMTLAITQPTTYAADGNATGAEVDIKTVDVYIYSGTTFLKRAGLTASDFTKGANNVWTLKEGSKIATTTGAKTIYVGVNLPTTPSSLPDIAAGIEGTNPATFAQTITAATDLGTTAAGYAMFSREAKTVNLVAPDAGGYETTNKVKVSVARLLAKVVVKKGSGLTDTKITGGNFTSFEFAVSNVNTKFFPLPSATFADPNYTTPWPTLGDFIPAVNASYVGINNAGVIPVENIKAVYTTENTSEGFLQGEHTYASVRGKFVPTTISGWNGTEITGNGGPLNADGDFYKVVVDGKNYFFSVEAQAKGCAQSKANGVYVKYTKGWAYYNVFLNPTAGGGEQKFDVLRNTIYTVNITKINGLGDGEDKVVEPEEPIGAPTNLSVEINIEAWSTNDQDSELTGK